VVVATEIAVILDSEVCCYQTSRQPNLSRHVAVVIDPDTDGALVDQNSTLPFDRNDYFYFLYELIGRSEWTIQVRVFYLGHRWLISHVFLSDT
jgi:hypothetical protein